MRSFNVYTAKSADFGTITDEKFFKVGSTSRDINS